MNDEIHEFCRKAIVLGFRGIEELTVTAGRTETGGTYDPESLRRAEACLATALDMVRLAKALVGGERRVSTRETLPTDQQRPLRRLAEVEAAKRVYDELQLEQRGRERGLRVAAMHAVEIAVVAAQQELRTTALPTLERSTR
jgi:hypothetical protein